MKNSGLNAMIATFALLALAALVSSGCEVDHGVYRPKKVSVDEFTSPTVISEMGRLVKSGKALKDMVRLADLAAGATIINDARGVCVACEIDKRRLVAGKKLAQYIDADPIDLACVREWDRIALIWAGSWSEQIDSTYWLPHLGVRATLGDSVNSLFDKYERNRPTDG